MRRSNEVIGPLRGLAPRESLTVSEGLALAERQAARLRLYWQLEQPAVPDRLLHTVPGVLVERLRVWPTSGMAVRVDDLGWRIVVRASEPRARQRFTLAHELKHVLDDPFVERWGWRRREQERVCDAFAAALLMPAEMVVDERRALRRTDVDALAERFQVSLPAMERRLRDLQLLEPADVQEHRHD